jgi:hypothetical protein
MPLKLSVRAIKKTAELEHSAVVSTLLYPIWFLAHPREFVLIMHGDDFRSVVMLGYFVNR